MKLVVKHQFADYQVGDQISKPADVDRILSGDLQHNVVKIEVTADDVAAVAKPPKTK